MYSQKRTTPVEDLLDLDDNEFSQQDRMRQHEHMRRNEHMYRDRMRHEKHMNFHNGPPGGIPEKLAKFIRPAMELHPGSGMNPYNQPLQDVSIPHSLQDVPVRPSIGSPTCLEIADHVGACPICSRFYKNDNTIYIIAIVILAIICILLLKKVLNL